MKINNCLKILNLDTDYTIDNIETLSISTIKKAYHIMALELHPDKNSLENANEKFIELKNAYNFLLKYKNHEESQTNNKNDDSQEESSEYYDLLINFIKLMTSYYGETDINITPKYHSESNINSNNFQDNCKEYMYKIINQIFNGLSIDTLQEIYIFLSKIQEQNIYNINISTKIFQIIKDLLISRLKDYNIFILTPSLKNLLNSDIYKLEIEKEKDVEKEIIYVPLWHNELNYENNIIKIEPVLDNNITIDENNNIYYTYKNTFETIIDMMKNNINIEIELADLNLFVPLNELYIKKNQTYILKNRGISYINTNEIFNNTLKANIIIHIELS
jgi:hypothetical protein